jgi:hypothetical protein
LVQNQFKIKLVLAIRQLIWPRIYTRIGTESVFKIKLVLAIRQLTLPRIHTRIGTESVQDQVGASH